MLKLLITDLDNTLWKGLAGEQSVRPRVTYQRALLRLKRQGVLLAIASKNNLSDAKAAFSAPGMVLAFNDFTFCHISWTSKTHMIKEILEAADFAQEHCLFIDDSVEERAEIEAFFPEMEVGKPDIDLKRYYKPLSEITQEDLERAYMIEKKREREATKPLYKSREEYLHSLGLIATIHVNDLAHLTRAAQMMERITQFRLNELTLSKDELREYVKTNLVYTVTLEDKFGAFGVVGLILLKGRDVSQFLLSCRVLTLGVEYALAESLSLKPDYMNYKRLERNAPMKDFITSLRTTTDLKELSEWIQIRYER